MRTKIAVRAHIARDRKHCHAQCSWHIAEWWEGVIRRWTCQLFRVRASKKNHLTQPSRYVTLRTKDGRSLRCKQCLKGEIPDG